MPRRQRYLGKGQLAVCMRSGIKCHASELVRDGRLTSLLVLPEYADEAHPQERPYVPVDEEGTPRFPVSPDQTPTTAPVLTASLNEAQTEVTITWTAAERIAGPRIEYYDLYRDSGDGYEMIDTVTVEYDMLGAIEGPALEATDTDIEVGVTYTYRVTASTSNGLSLVSNTDSVTPDEPITLTAPVLSIGADQFEADLSWTAATSPLLGDTITAYDIYRSVDGGDYSLLTSVDGVTLSYSDSSVDLLSVYTYYVIATAASGAVSPASNVVEFLSGEELTPPELDFTQQAVDTYFDLQPAALVAGTETFAADTGQFATFTDATLATFAVTGGNGRISQPGGAIRTAFVVESASSFQIPQAFVSVDLVSNPLPSGGFDVVGCGLFKSGTQYVGAFYDRQNAILRIQIANGGGAVFLGSVAGSISLPGKLGFSLIGNRASVWKDVGSGWEHVTTADVSGTYNFNTAGNLTDFKAGFFAGSPDAVEWNFDNLVWGAAGGVGMRDQIWVLHDDNTPYFPSPGVAMFTATVNLPEASYVGNFTIDLTTFEIAQVGAVMVERSGTIYTDLNLTILLRSNGEATCTTATWGNGFGGSLQVQRHDLADWSVLTGSQLLDSPTTLSLPGLLTGSYGAYDPMLVRDVQNSRWLLCYTITQDTTFAGSPFYAAAAYSSDLTNWTLIGADSANLGYEGTKLSFHKGEWWVAAGGPAGASTSSRVYHASDMSFAGTLDVVFDGGSDTQPHPPMIPYGDLVYLLTFDNTRYGGYNFSWGQPQLYTAPRYS